MNRSQFVTAWFGTGKDGKLCFYCGKPFSKGKKGKVTSEHILPKYLYKDFRFNVVRACFGCNNKKNGNPISLWREIFLKREGEQLFYCERVLGTLFPDDTSWNGGAPPEFNTPETELRIVLLDLVEIYYNRLLLILRRIQ